VRRWAARTAPVMKELLAVRYVHYAIDPKTREFTEDAVTMAVKAGQRALQVAGIAPSDVDLICYGSAHQDQMPTASVRIQEALGIERCDELSIHANCTSAYKALYLAHQLIAAGRNRVALVLSSSISSSELRAEYYNQPLVDRESLFLRWFLSDGAGALVVTADVPRRPVRVEHTYIESIGGKRPSLMYNLRPALWLNPAEEFRQGLHHPRQRFRNELSSGVFQEPDGSVFVKGLRRMLAQAGVDAAGIRYFQVNLPSRHIIDSVIDECRSLGIAASAFYTALDELGYCGPPMMMICLDRILRSEPLAPGDRAASFVTEVSKFMQAGYILRHE
jgi:3-oxoacyl-[acyl-carrier-protein] synthase III